MDKVGFEIPWPDGAEHSEGEVSKRCWRCGKPTVVWRFVSRVGRLLPCYEPCGCERSADPIAQKMRAAGVPERFLDAEVPNLPESSSYLYGAPRTGKTTTACCLVRKALEDGRSAMFTTMRDIAEHEHLDRDRGRSFLEKLRAADLLIIDDIGKGSVGEWAANEVYSIIDGRYGSMKGLCITSNYSLSELARELAKHADESLAQSIARRINDVCKLHRYGQQRL